MGFKRSDVGARWRDDMKCLAGMASDRDAWREMRNAFVF